MWLSPFFISAFILIYRWLFTYIFPFVDRYHYIQAVEQFKQYQADEQWIAVGADVFESKNASELMELKDQCIKSGFGLMEVTEDLVVSIIIAPSRIPILRKRQKLNLTISSEIAQRIGRSKFLKISNTLLRNSKLDISSRIKKKCNKKYLLKKS